MKRTEAPIQSPCSADWNAMVGDDRKRFCSLCDKHVHNLSAMTETEARGVVANQKVCVRYSLNPATQTIRHRPARQFMVRAAATAALTAGLALPAAAAISREPGEVGLLTQVWEALTDWSDDSDEMMMGGLEMVEEPVVEPVTTEEPPDLEPLMGDIMMPEPVKVKPVEIIELGELPFEPEPAPAVESE